MGSGGDRGKQTVQDPESPVPLHVGQPGGVSETFGKRVAVDLQFGNLGKDERNRSVRPVLLLLIILLFFCFPVVVFPDWTCLVMPLLCNVTTETQSRAGLKYIYVMNIKHWEKKYKKLFPRMPEHTLYMLLPLHLSFQSLYYTTVHSTTKVQVTKFK